MSAKSCYCLLASTELARLYPTGQAVPVSELSASTGVPVAFLVQIFQSLRRAGLVRGVRGVTGGYILERSPDQISVAQLLRAISGGGHIEPHSAATRTIAEGTRADLARSLDRILNTAEDALENALAPLTLAVLLRES
jgi:Rrf2 family transcriptional regulator, cysteine metabolism repressor